MHLNNPAITRISVICILRSAAISRIFVLSALRFAAISKILKWTFRPTGGHGSLLWPLLLGFGHGPFKIWQRDRTQAQTDVRGARARGQGSVSVSVTKLIPNNYRSVSVSVSFCQINSKKKNR